MASACSNLHMSVSATRRQYKALSDTAHLACTGTRFCSLRQELQGSAEC